MTQVAVVRAAIDLLHVPSRLQAFRAEPVPICAKFLLDIVAGDEHALQVAAALVKRDAETIVRAAEFYIEQIFLFPEADSYRVLGVQRNSSSVELRQHMVLLLKWLHPDIERSGERAVLAHRVTRAWQDLKTEDRRAEYDLFIQATTPLNALPGRSGRLTSRVNARKRLSTRAKQKLRGEGIIQRTLRYFMSPHSDRS